MYKNQEQAGYNAFQLATDQHNNPTIYQNQPVEGQKFNTVQQYQNQPVKQVYDEKQAVNTVESIKYWLISLGLFAGAFAIYIIVWAVQKFALNHQIASHYYEKSYNWSGAVPATHQVKVAADAKSIALQLVLQWLMWKGPLLFFTFNCMKLNEGKLKWILLGVAAFILLAADILLTIFLLYIYNNMMYFGLFSIVTVIMGIVTNSSINRVKQGVLDSLLPLLCIGVIVTIQVLLLPILYYVYYKNLSAQASVFLTFYAYPFIDLIMYTIILLMGNYVTHHVRTFYSQIHYLLNGYEVGFILLVGYTEVEFYYLCSYLIFRNLFTNWVMWRWENVLKLPPVLPGWGIAYYFSYALMFIPFAGVGNIIIGTGYYSLILINTSTVLYALPSSLYPSDMFTPSSNLNDFQLNPSFKGDIFKIAAVIIWFATTLSQRYSKKMPQIVNTVVYNIFGIYLFYIGLSAGLSTPSLTQYSVIA